MKPIRLVLKGLNSFYNEQTIDFEKLTRRGLFGIFGPTGSGKSTILDGITLALYGRIARGSTDYINKNTDTAKVIYEFQLSGVCDSRYLVEREIKRNAKGEVRTTSARLLKIQEDTIVLEEKVSAVNSRCEEIIGLNAEDFLRTVVLPQGKFSEFLKLQNAPRRQMLERLFGLEKYGEELMSRVGTRVQSAKDDRNRIEGQLQGYEGASEELHIALKEEIRLKTEALAAVKKHFEEVTASYKVAEDVRSLQLERAKIKEAQARLELQAPVYREREEQIMMAEKALVLKPLISTFRETQAKYSHASEESMRLKMQKTDLESVHVTNLTAYETAKVRRSERAPQLVRREAELSAALKEKAEIKVIQEGLVYLEARLQEHRRISTAKTQEKTAVAEAKERLEAAIRSIEDRIEKAAVSEVFRHQLQTAVETEKTVAGLTERVNEINEKMSRLNGSLRDISDEKAALTVKIEWAKDAAKESDQRQRQHAVVYLRTLLTEGEPCPVCGAETHPFASDKAELMDGGAPLDNGQTAADMWAALVPLEQALGELNGHFSSETRQLRELESELALKLAELKGESAVLETQMSALKVQNLPQALEKVSESEKQRTADVLRLREMKGVLQENQEAFDAVSKALTEIHLTLAKEEAEYKARSEAVELREMTLLAVIQGNEDIDVQLEAVKREIKALEHQCVNAEAALKAAVDNLQLKREAFSAEERACGVLRDQLLSDEAALAHGLKQTPFSSVEEADEKMMEKSDLEELKRDLTAFKEEAIRLEGAARQIDAQIGGRDISEGQWQAISDGYRLLEAQAVELEKSLAALENSEVALRKQIETVAELLVEKEENTRKLGMLEDLAKLFSGRKFVSFIAAERLNHICGKASELLMQITSGAYALESDADGDFTIRDYKNGGLTRDPASLSGGETFLVSLALALALSVQIQLKGNTSLELFFLDEGFGTLDDEILDVVMSALENMHHQKLSIGLISHVDSIKNRVPAKLVVSPGRSGEGGSRIRFELS